MFGKGRNKQTAQAPAPQAAPAPAQAAAQAVALAPAAPDTTGEFVHAHRVGGKELDGATAVRIERAQAEQLWVVNTADCWDVTEHTGYPVIDQPGRYFFPAVYRSIMAIDEECFESKLEALQVLNDALDEQIGMLNERQTEIEAEIEAEGGPILRLTPDR